MNPQTELVPFYGEKILTLVTDDGVFVPVKPICERLGLAWQPQHRKLTDPENDWRCHHMVIPTNGGLQEMTCLSLIDFPLWLASISPSKVKEEVREAFKLYRREAKQVLFEHFINRQKKMETALSVSHSHLLAQNPRWSKIKALIDAGVSEYLIYKRSNMARDQFDEEMKEMERCAMLNPSTFHVAGEETLLQERNRLRAERVLLKWDIENLTKAQNA